MERQQTKRTADGLTVLVGPEICVAGRVKDAGSTFLRDYRPPFEATAVTRLKEAGAVLEDGPADAEFNLTPALDAAAQAVAARPGAVALATDFGGQIGLAAARRGLFGLTAAAGLVSRFGLITPAPSLVRLGFLSQTRPEAEAVLAAVAGPDGHDAVMLEKAPEPGRAGRALVIRELAEELPEEGREAWKLALEGLKAEGLSLDEISWPDIRLASQAHQVILAVEAMSSLGRFNGFTFGRREQSAHDTWEIAAEKSRLAGLSSATRLLILEGAFFSQAEEYRKYFLKAAALRRRLSNGLYKMLAEADLVAAPAALEPRPPFMAAAPAPALAGLAVRAQGALARWTTC